MKTVQLYQKHIELGAKMVPFAGYEMPLRYTSDKEEHLCVRQNVGVFDVSHMGEFFVKGEEALDFLQFISSNDVSKLEVGQAQYAYLPNDKGGIVDDFLTYKISDQEYLLVVNASNIEKDWKWLNEQNKTSAVLENVSDDFSLFAVQGPKAIEALQSITKVNLSGINFYHFVSGEMAGVSEVIISATGYTGAGGFELYVKNKDAEKLWNAIFESGKDFGIQAIGLGARDTLRLEMGYCLYGNDITEETSPLEAGLGWVTKFSKDFVGKSILESQKEKGLKKKLVALVLEEKGIPRSGYLLENEDGETVGTVTSGLQSPSLEKGIALAYIHMPFHKVGTVLNLIVRKKKLKTRVVKSPVLNNA